MHEKHSNDEEVIVTHYHILVNFPKFPNYEFFQKTRFRKLSNQFI